MNTLNTYSVEFYHWWNCSGRPECAVSNLECLIEEAYRGWRECMIERHTLIGAASKLRGIGAYCGGWNAAIDFIERGDYDDNGRIPERTL